MLVPGAASTWIVWLWCASTTFNAHICTLTSLPQVLGVLAVLARGPCFDQIAELTNTGAEVHRKFFLVFVKKFPADQWRDWCTPPEDPSQDAGALSLS